MTDETTRTAAEQRRLRLEAQLRDNLRRRKDQARARREEVQDLEAPRVPEPEAGPDG
ncbi:hypothetical protein [Mangrovibrevibacter kandeliae]|uniref:hypothetical protein n=1 Tax=Mangrovibrevibacter kandeliae TaxID=2968473 RepID=UPI0021185741|nr:MULTISPECIES: hypothetical protein [unclassified Aurantimonas]MCQ8783289.1 hypothetical protein [Aurantimonas sp. CSK15Z-1]MCW4116196.1 hypothetical protein [Aurantimonas sp. MSK8Z-1]